MIYSRAMRTRHLAIPFLLALILLVPASAQAPDETGQPAPRFRAKTTSGEQFDNDSVKGKVVLFEFWTTWCEYCEEEATMVDNIAREFKRKDLIVLAVERAGTRSTGEKVHCRASSLGADRPHQGHQSRCYV